MPVESTHAVFLFPTYAVSHLLRSALLSFRSFKSASKRAISPAIPSSITVLKTEGSQPFLDPYFDCIIAFAAVTSVILVLIVAISV